MNLKRIQDLLDYLEKVTKENFNMGKDKRAVFLKDLFEKYTYYNMDLDEESASIMEKADRLIEKFSKLKMDISSVSNEYVYTSAIYLKYLNGKIGNESSFLLRGNMKKAIEKDHEENLTALCQMIKSVLMQTGILDYSISLEQKSLESIGLEGFLTEQFVNQDKLDLLSEKKIQRGDNDQLEVKALCMFWTNKLTKVIENCMLGYLLEQTLKRDYDESEINVRQTNAQQRNIVFLKFDLMRAIWEYCEKKFPNMTHRDDLLKQYLLHSKFKRGKISKKEYHEIVRERGFVRSNESFGDFLKAMNFMPKDFAKLFMQVEQKYNELFPGKEGEEESFFQDFNVLLNMYGAQEALYEVKNQLNKHIFATLLSYKQHRKGLPYLIKNCGISEDSRSMDKKQILHLELKGYIKPISVHLDDQMGEYYKMIGIPTYQGVFNTKVDENNSYLAVNYVFRLNDEQKIQLKKVIKEKRARINATKGRLKNMKEDDKTKEGLLIDCTRMEKQVSELEAMREMAGPKSEVGR